MYKLIENLLPMLLIILFVNIGNNLAVSIHSVDCYGLYATITFETKENETCLHYFLISPIL